MLPVMLRVVATAIVAGCGVAVIRAAISDLRALRRGEVLPDEPFVIEPAPSPADSD